MKKLTIMAVLLASAICAVMAQPKDRIRISDDKNRFERVEFNLPMHTFNFGYEPNGNFVGLTLKVQLNSN